MTNDKDMLEWGADQGLPHLLESEAQMDGLPQIQVSGRHMRHITADAIKVLEAANDLKPFLFRRGSALVRLTPGPGTTTAESLTMSSLRGILDRHAYFIKTNERGIESPARPSNDVIQDMLSLPELPFQWLQGFHSAPVFTQSGDLLNRSGYNKETGLFLSLDGLDGVAADMTLEYAKQLIFEDLLIDFPFSENGSKTHALVLLLQGFVRLLIDGPTPLFLIDAPARGTGKGLLADLISPDYTGYPRSYNCPAARRG